MHVDLIAHEAADCWQDQDDGVSACIGAEQGAHPHRPPPTILYAAHVDVGVQVGVPALQGQNYTPASSRQPQKAQTAQAQIQPPRGAGIWHVCKLLPENTLNKVLVSFAASESTTISATPSTSRNKPQGHSLCITLRSTLGSRDACVTDCVVARCNHITHEQTAVVGPTCQLKPQQQQPGSC